MFTQPFIARTTKIKYSIGTNASENIKTFYSQVLLILKRMRETNSLKIWFSLTLSHLVLYRKVSDKGTFSSLQSSIVGHS